MELSVYVVHSKLHAPSVENGVKLSLMYVNNGIARYRLNL
jgi:hypothetical protein